MVNRFAPVVCWLVLALFLVSCGNDEPQWTSIEGKTMGTTYHVQYFGTKKMQLEVDKLLEEINQSVSTYIPSSTISEFNNSGYLAIPLQENGIAEDVLHIHFFANLEEAHEVWEASDGYFDPTVGPLVEAWGFGSAGRDTMEIDSGRISVLLTRVGLDLIEVEATADTIHVRSRRSGVRLDFSALAKGYGVDRVADLLATKSVRDYFIEIGGEVRVAGDSPRGDSWICGISKPEEHSDISEFTARIQLRDAAMATSGNYRNFYIRDGRKVWHTINPKTGFPEENDLLSATIVHPSCMTADALATACMALGVDDAIGMIRKIEGAEGYFIYLNAKGEILPFATEKLAKDILE